MIECTTLRNNKILIPREQLSFRLAVYGVALFENMILLVQGRSSGHLWFPGGGIKPGEYMEATLKREFIEETGINVKTKDFIKFQEEFFYHDVWKRAFHSFRFYFLCQPLNIDVIADEGVEDGESEKPRWHQVNELSQSSFDQSYGFEILKLALDHLRTIEK